MNSFGFKLKEERERLGLSQTEFAEACGVKRVAQGNYENDKRNPDAAYLMAAAKLGVDVNYLITGVRMTSPYGVVNNSDEAEMLAEYREGDEDARDVARYTLAKAAARKREAS
ncbi:XRE family transcriptional regulator [Salmonella enterica subsp. enterica serovar Oranienburg]|nr:helix-turn-helix transcriptional regulator [Salmonella enterica]EBX2202606.1 XRE family transcriptional regulator [Salmonella enterica subsp. enterica serovar Oranienburg]